VAAVRVRVGHSADPDDAFMFWALDAGRVDTRGLEFEPVVSDIQTLNEWATGGRLEVTAISMGAYPDVADRYVLLPHGASMGNGYGPVVVAREPLDLGEWWLLETGLPLPLGVTVARRDLGPRLRDVSEVLGEAIRKGLAHRDEAMEYALRFGRGIDARTADEFVSMYVNELTCDYGEEGRAAVAELLRRAGADVDAQFVA
jgi:predicted solute-binding protein